MVYIVDDILIAPQVLCSELKVIESTQLLALDLIYLLILPGWKASLCGSDKSSLQTMDTGKQYMYLRPCSTPVQSNSNKVATAPIPCPHTRDFNGARYRGMF